MIACSQAALFWLGLGSSRLNSSSPPTTTIVLRDATLSKHDTWHSYVPVQVHFTDSLDVTLDRCYNISSGKPPSHLSENVQTF